MEQRLYNAKLAYEALMKFNSNTNSNPKPTNVGKIENDLKQYSK
jgi:hypothetical protein